jgi:hypothetical protein
MRTALALLLVIPALAAAQSAEQRFIGQWNCQVEGEPVSLHVLNSTQLRFGDELMTYRITTPNTVVITQQGFARPHRYTLAGDRLDLFSPEQFTITCERRRGNPGKAAAAATLNDRLSGLLCSYAASRSATGSGSWSSRVRFDGRGRFTTGSESSFNVQSGLGHSAGVGEGGTYAVTAVTVGAPIRVRWDSGEDDVAYVQHVASGRITEIKYGKQVFAAGLCD